jgi:O-antigen/teichoic acid export membrane protein
MALMGYGIWALVVPSIFSGILKLVLSLILSKYRPQLIFSRSELRRALNFGLSSLASSIANVTCNNVVYIVMGKVWISRDLGIYSFAQHNRTFLFGIFSQFFFTNLFPILSKAGQDIERIRRAYLKIIKITAFVIFPTFAMAFWSTPYVFFTLFGNKWNGAIFPFQILMGLSVVNCLSLGANAVLYTKHKPHISAGISSFRLLLYLLFIGLSAYYSLGVVSTVTGLALAEFVIILLYLAAVLISLSIRIEEYIVVLLEPIFVTILMIIGVSTAKELIVGQSIRPITTIVIAALTWMLVMVFFCWRVREIRDQIVSWVASLR